MKKHYVFIVFVATLLVAAFYVINHQNTSNQNTQRLLEEIQKNTTANANEKTALLADGCFWCVEHDIEKVPGVIGAISGYAGGSGDNPTYENYAEGGFREVVLVTYDASKVSYANLVEHILKHGDPTDTGGSFHDRGPQYVPAIYYADISEKETAEKVIHAIDQTNVFEKPLPIAVIPRVAFWPAEDYHQDYGNKNPVRYGYYRSGSGRDAFIKTHWGDSADTFTVSNDPSMKNTTASSTAISLKPWESYRKPSNETLHNSLSPLQFAVTQEEGTERPFDNMYDTNKEAGIYVDILSGEPLYSSKDKYDSGTGWPSFVKPISDDAVVLKEDHRLFSTRIEVRSRFGDNHLGHVFPDGPIDRGGKRYCMNSAALRFIPLADMEKEGYGEYIELIK